jgi:hypothetical protein
VNRNIVSTTFISAVFAIGACGLETDDPADPGDPTASVEQGANVHLVTQLQCEDQGLFLEATGKLAGLGNKDVTITLTATALIESTCTNPSGRQQPPGQNPAPVTVSGTETIPKEEIMNGNVVFDVTTTPLVSPIPGAPGCPNPRWTQTITDVTFTNATLTVKQGGQTVLTATCTPT